LAITAQAIRAILLASAVAATLVGRGRPVDHSNLLALLERRGPVPPEFVRGYLSRALATFPDDIVYQRGHGYWLRHRPWSRADYNPVRKKTAA
jgi:hypothetical protein